MALAVATPAGAQLCNGVSAPVSTDGRALGHLPYGDAAPDALTRVPAGIAVGGCVVRREIMPDLERLVAAAAADPATGGRILALSCHRSIPVQTAVFCGKRQSADGAERAISAAPPGHSEHATGYAVDFAVRPTNGCPDAEACMAATPMFRWLKANAPRFGFEMSFPVGSPQNVKWEPWHWRWVGATATAPGAARARFLFARARRDFPADPAVDPVPVVVAPPPAARPVATPTPVPDEHGQRRRRR